MTTTTSYAQTAERLAKQFAVNMRFDRDIVTITDDGPDHDALLAMTFDASQAGLSTDYAYTMVRDVLGLIADTDPDALDETDVDSLVDVYDHDLMRFIADGLNRQFADDAMEQQPFNNLMAIVTAAQFLAYQAALNAVVANWPADSEAEES